MPKSLDSAARINNFYHAMAFVMAIALFVAGRFGFFDILGLKRIFEIFIFVPVTLLGFLLICMMPNVWLQPFFLLPCSYLLFRLMMNPDLLILGDLSIASIFTGVILVLGYRFADIFLRYIIAIASVFAFLGLFEFCLLLINPELVDNILLFYDQYSGSIYPVFDNAMQLLGLADGTTYHVFGFTVTRLRSFASEPSLLVGYFLMPGALALTFHDKRFTLCGLLCISFCIISLAGSVYSALACAAFSIIFLIIKRKHIVTYAPFILLIIFFWLIYFHFNELLLLTRKSSNDYDFLDKTHSANMRFGYIRDFIPKIFTSPFGVSEDIEQPLGFLVGSTARAGILGFILALLLMFKMYNVIDKLIVQKQLYLMQQVGLIIIYGSLTMGLVYLDNCFIQIYGFTLLVLTYCRLVTMRERLENR